jgi:hypothetical protein
LIESFYPRCVEIGPVFIAPLVAQATETFSATLTPETPAGKESTEESVTVKARVTKRSKESVFSLEDSRTGTDLNLVSARLGGCGAGETVGWGPTLFP